MGETTGVELCGLAPAPVPRAALAQAALLVLGSVGPDTRTAVVGRHAAAIAAAARYFGGQGAEIPTELEALRELPDASCDTLLLNRDFDRGTALGVRAGAADALRETVRQCRRALAPGGRLLLAMDNPLSVKNIREAIQRSGRLPRRSTVEWARACVRAVRSQLELLQVYLLQPDLDRWQVLQPRRVAPPGVADFTLRGRMRNLGVRASHLLGLEARFAPGHLLVAGAAGGNRPGPCLVERLATAEGLICGEPLIVAQPNSRSVTFSAGELFFKVPLSGDAEEALASQTRALASLAEQPVATFAPLPARLRQAHGVRYATFPRLPAPDRAPTASDMIEFMEALHGTPRAAPLSETDLWSRLFAPGDREMLSALGAGELLRHLEQHTAARGLPTAPIHGDLHAANVIARGSRRYLVDWDRFEAHSPILLDYVEAFLSCGRAGVMMDWSAKVERLQRILCGSEPLFGRRIIEACGELAPAEAVAVYVLHRTSWMLRRHGLNGDRELEVMRDQVGSCRRLLFESPPQ